MAKNIGSTLGDLFGNIYKGALKSLEGIYDFHVGTVGLIGGWFDKGFQENMQKHIENDWTADRTKWLDDVQKHSYISDWEIGDNVRNVAGGVGGMLPSVALSFIPYAGAGLSMGATMSAAAGNTMESSLREGASYGSSFAYGLGAGLVEGATEKIGGFAFGKSSKLAKATSGTKFGNAISKGAGKVLFDAASEGAEEVLSDLADPTLKYVTGVDRNIGANYRETFRGLPQTFVEGALVGSIMQGGYTVGSNIKNTVQGRGGAKATRADTAIENISEISKLYGESNDKNFKYDTAIRENLSTISNELVKMKPEARTKYLESTGIFKNAFDSQTGKLKENLVGDTNRRAISAKLRTISGTLTHKPLKSNEGITKEAESIKQTVERVLGKSATVAVTNELDAKEKALFNPRDGVIYINNKAKFNGEDKVKIIALHEITHATEGTKAYTSFIETLEKVIEDKSAPQSIKDIIGDVSARTDKIKSDYKEQIEAVKDKYSQGYLVQSELHADVAAELLGNDYFVDKLAQRDENLFKKIFDSFKNRASAKKSELGPDGVKYLNKLASKFETAIERRQGGVMLSSLGEKEEKGKEEKINARSKIVALDNGNTYVYGDRKVIKGNTVDEIRNDISGFFNALLSENSSLDIPTLEGDTLTITKANTANKARDNYKTVNGAPVQMSDAEFALKGRIEAHIDEIAETAIKEKGGRTADTKNHPFAKDGFSYRTAYFEDFDGSYYKLRLSIGHDGTTATVYNVGKIEKGTLPSAKIIAVVGSKAPVENASDDSIYDNRKKINTFDERKYKSSENEPDFEAVESNDFEGTEQLSQEDAQQGKGLVEFVNAVEQMTDKSLISKRKHRIGRVSVEHAEFAQTLLEEIGIDVNLKNFELWIDGTGAQHIEIRHGKDGKADNTVAEDELKAKIPWAVNNADSGEIIRNDKGEIEYSNRFFNADGSKAPQIKLYKKIGENTLYISECVADSKFRRIYITSSYIKKGSKGQLLNMEEQSSPQPTPEASFDSNATNNIIHDNLEKNNSFDERKYKSSENEPDFEAVDGGVKVNFNDFSTDKSNDKSNDFKRRREQAPALQEDAERARKESLDSLVKNGEPTRRSPISVSPSELKRVVNNTKAKKYTRKEVKSTIDELLSQEGYYGDNVVALKGKKRSEAEKMLWQELNTKGKGELGGAALEVADYIIQNAIATEYSDVTDDVELAAQFMDACKPYLHNMNLDFIKGDIKAKFDKDNTPYLMWGVKKGSPFRGYTADEVAGELEALGFSIDKTSEADIFLEIDKLYRLAKQTIVDATPSKETLVKALGSKEAQKLKQKLAKDIIEAQYTKGTETSFYKLQQKYIKKIAELGEKVKTAHRRNTLENRILKEAKKIVDSNKHTFANATEIQTDALKNIKKLLSRVNSREQVNRSTLRAIMKELAIWYSEKNPVLEGFYDSYIAEHLNYFAQSEIDETPSTAERSPSLEDGGIGTPVPTIEISADSELAERIKNSGKSKYDVIEEYLIEKFYGQEFTLSDGKKAIMDKRDANKLSAKANEARTTQLANLKKIVEKAVYSHSADNIEHNKFSSFDYYSISVKIGEDTFDLWLNVGTAKNDGKHHIYALTNKKEEAPTKNGVSRPVGNAIQNASSTDSITENSQNVKREKPLSMSELETVNTILHHMNHIFENYGKMWRGGQYVEASDVASAQYSILVEAEKNHSSFERTILHNKAVRFAMDPMAVLAAWDGHDPNGYFTTTLREFEQGLVGQLYDEMRALEEFDKFRQDKKNKAYMKNLVSGKDKIKVSGRIDPRNLSVSEIEIPKNVAIDLYMVSKTGQAIETLEKVGYKIKLDGEHVQETMQSITRGQIEEMYNKFSKQDKELIAIMERAYNGICRDLKYETDMKRLGFSNVFEGYYYPINRVSATDFDTNNFFAMMERVSNISSNKSRVKGAKNAIIASNALSKFMRHVNGVTRYANLAIPVENMNRVFNLDIAGDKHMPTSIKMKLQENDLWKGAEDYMKRLSNDVQNVGLNLDGGSRAIAWLRGNYAKFQLGANPKVWFSQLSSYVAAYGELSFSSLAKAPTIKGSIKDSDVDKYCRLAAVRHYDKASTKAQAVTDKAGNVLTAPIEAVDRGVIKMLFAACQAEAKARYKLEIGTEENKVKAGEILTEVILRSQQNQLVTEQSAAMRSTSEIIKSFTMFNADSMKLLSRFVQSLGEIATLNKRIKAAEAKGDKALAEQLTVQKKRASKALRKYSATIIAVAVYMAALAKLFKLAYNKDDEEETVLEWLGKGTVDNIIGMVPFVRDVYTFFNDGYETDIFVTSMANDVLTSFGKTRDIFADWVSGKEVTSEELNSNIRNLSYSIGQIFGLPTRNIYNLTTGIIRRIDEGTGKSIDALFKAPTESGAKESLLEGIEKKDESLINYSLDALYSKYDIELSDKVLKAEMDRLIKLDASKDSEDESNYNPLGFKIPENLEIDGEDVELSAEDRNVFKNGLKLAEKASVQLVRTAMYKRMSDESKAYAIRKVYQYYDALSRCEVTAGASPRPTLVYFGEAVGIEILAQVMAYRRELNAASDEDTVGASPHPTSIPRTTTRTKSTKQLVTEYLRQFNLSPVEKSLVLRALGYSDKSNDALVKAYINRRYNLTKEQKAEFLEYAKVN